MGASGSQLALMDRWAWLVGPSTGRTAFGAAPSTGATPSTARLTGPYQARLQLERQPQWPVEGGAAVAPAGEVLVASTVAAPARTVAVVVSTSTDSTAGTVYPAAGVRVYFDDVGIHHLTLTIGRNG